MMENVILKLDISKGMNKLSYKERMVIKLLFYYSYTEATLGERLNVSRSRIRNIKNSALKKLKDVVEFN
jgi:RNA polymerase sigma factor (sigma-70 family)